MSKIVAARFWVCEICNLPLYEYHDMEKHLLEVHGVDCNSTKANAGLAGDNLIVSDLAIPSKVKSMLEKM